MCLVTWLMLVLTLILGGCYANPIIDNKPITRPRQIGFIVTSLDQKTTFMEIPQYMYKVSELKNDIKIEAYGFQTYKGKSSEVITLTPDPVFWLASLIWAEARGEPLLGQAAVGQVVLNRVKDLRFNNSIVDVIFEYTETNGKKHWQFSCIPDQQIYIAWQDKNSFENIRTLAQEIVSGSRIDPELTEALGFFNPEKVLAYDPYRTNWVWKQPVLKEIGNHRFFSIPY